MNILRIDIFLRILYSIISECLIFNPIKIRFHFNECDQFYLKDNMF